ncbi:hypothetical protein H2198_002235, partial [Neophaeococcomyces mojaviensis]
MAELARERKADSEPGSHVAITSLQVDDERRTPDIDLPLDVAAENGHVATDKYGKPLVHFDAAAEARLRMKIDIFIIPTIALLYLFCFIDRANIGNARLAGFERDLKLKGNDYNSVLSAFYIGYIIFELPSTLANKYVGPGWYIPGMALAFGITTIVTGFCTNKANVSA